MTRKNKQTRKQNAVKINSTNKESIVTAPTSMFRNLPKSSFSIREGSIPGSILIKGSEYIGSVSTGAAVAPIGTVLRNDFLSPGAGMFQGGRLPLFAKMYDKYRFKRINFRYNPVVPTSSQGAILIAMDKDYADLSPQITGGDDTVLRSYLSWEFCTTGPSWAMSNLLVTFSSDKDKFYYTNDTGYDGRLVYQGQFYTVVAASLLANTRYGFISADYEIEFVDPQLDESYDYSFARLNGTTSYGTLNWNPVLTDIGPTTTILMGVGKVINETINGFLQKGIYVPEGSYLIEQLVKQVVSIPGSGGPYEWGMPTILNAYSGQSNSTAVNIVTSGAFSSLDSFLRVDKFTAPPGGAKIFGNLVNSPNGSPSLNDVMIRIIPTLKSLIA